MIRRGLIIRYANGDEDKVEGTQYGVGRFAQYLASKGWSAQYNAHDPGVMSLLQLRYMAWAEVQRNRAQKQSFDVWDALVDEVEAEQGADDVDPTGPAISAG